MDELKKRAENLRSEVAQAANKLKIDQQSQELEQLQAQMAQPGFWDDNLKAQERSKQAAVMERRVKPWQELQESINELLEMLKVADGGMSRELGQNLDSIEQKFAELKSDLKFQGPYDDHDVLLSIYAGAGGTDAQDWAQMLERMYLRWAEKQALKAEVIDESVGEEAGIKSATIKLTNGDFLYGKLSGEHGVHRLVRLSPFNADNLRQTSFAKVDILPLIERPNELELDENDLKIDVFRAGGHGGQSVNTTDSAVRITHIPTGVTVAIQNERSQLQNKETALNILRSKLVQLQLEQHTQNLAEIKGPNEQAAWGNQIRNYVLHPYKQVKDLRTGYETSDPQTVLDGSLEPFIDAWLTQVPKH
jgi:peptide chain release factor 2